MEEIHYWWVEPLLLIFFSIVATQMGNSFSSYVIKRLALEISHKRSNRGGSVQEVLKTDPQIKEEGAPDERSLDDRIDDKVMERYNSEQLEETKVLVSYLNQIAGTLSTIGLVYAYSLVLLARPATGIPYPSWCPIAIGILLILTGMIGIKIAFGGMESKSLAKYAGRNEWYPPATALTAIRIAVILTYSYLVLLSYWPMDKKSNSFSPIRDARPVPTPTLTQRNLPLNENPKTP